jgi:hypothetical protein
MILHTALLLTCLLILSGPATSSDQIRSVDICLPQQTTVEYHPFTRRTSAHSQPIPCNAASIRIIGTKVRIATSLASSWTLVSTNEERIGEFDGDSLPSLPSRLPDYPIRPLCGSRPRHFPSRTKKSTRQACREHGIKCP